MVQALGLVLTFHSLIPAVPLLPELFVCCDMSILVDISNLSDFSNPSELTLYGELSTAEKYAWITFLLFVLCSSILGDTTVLIVSLRYKVFQLHEFLVAIIQHIAVCNLLLSLRTLFFRLIPVFEERWILGSFWCSVNAFSTMYLYLQSYCLVCILSVGKFVLLKYPPRIADMTKNKAHLVCALTWTFSFTPILLWLIIDKDNVALDRRLLVCKYKYTSELWNKLHFLELSYIAALIMIIVVIYTSAHSLVILARAQRAGESRGETIQWQGVTTILLTVIVFQVSMLPCLVMHGLEKLAGDERKRDLYVPVRITSALVQLNVIANFYIYCMTVASFRKFLYFKLRCLEFPMYGRSTSSFHQGTSYS